MHLHQLINVFTELQSIFEKNELLKRYKNIVEHCQQLAKDVNNEDAKKSLQAEKKAIIEIHNQIEPILWHDLSFNCLHSAKDQQLLGKSLNEKLNGILVVGNTNYLHIAEEIKGISEKTNKWIKDVGDFINNNKNWNAILPEYLTGDEKKCTLKVFFANSTFIKTLQDLERNIRIWNNIFNVFTKLVEQLPEELYVYSVEQGFLIIKAPSKVTEAFSTAILSILSNHRKLLEIKKIKYDLGMLNLTHHEEISTLLEQESKVQIDQIAYELSNQLVDNYFSNINESNEITENVSLSVKQMMDFIEKGGKLDIDCLDNSIVSLNKSNIINMYNRIAELETELNNEY